MPVFTFKEVSDILEQECGNPFGRLKASDLGLRQYLASHSTMAAALGYAHPQTLAGAAAGAAAAAAGREVALPGLLLPALFELSTGPDGKLLRPRKGTRRFRWCVGIED
jgi:hypothetical protein